MQTKSDNRSNDKSGKPVADDYADQYDGQSNQRELQMQFQYLTSQIEQAKQQFTELKLVLEEAQETLLALAELESKPATTMTSLGSSIFVKSAIASDKVIAPIGANVYCQKSITEAKQIVEMQANKVNQLTVNVEKALTQMMQARQQIIQQAQQTSQ